GELLRELLDVVGEQEADAEHQLRSVGGELAHLRFAVGALAGLERLERDPELLLGALEAAIGGVVERLVAAAADVEHQSNRVGLGATAGGRGFGLRPAPR